MHRLCRSLEHGESPARSLVPRLAPFALIIGVCSASAAQAPPEAKRAQLPLVLHSYSSQVRLGVLDPVVHPSFALATEFPRLRAGDLSFFPSYHLGYEYHAHFQQRVYVAVAPSARWDLHRRVALQVSIGFGAARLWSQWTAYHFDAHEKVWSAGESQPKWTWRLDLDLVAWAKPTEQLSVGLGYGLGALYPFARPNDIPLLPLTRLGLYLRWVFYV